MILGEPERAWTLWDIKLITAHELYEDMRTGTGIPIYWDRSERVVFDVEHYTSKSKAALDRAEEKAAESKAKNYGKSFYVVPKTTDGSPLPTLEDWLKEQEERRQMMAGRIRVGGDKFSNAGWEPKGESLA